MAIDFSDDLEYGAQRLSGSIVQYKGYPVLVDFLDPDGNIAGTVYGTQRFNGTQIKLKDCDMTPFVLGYMNGQTGRATYLYRTPIRYYKHGLNSGNAGYKAENGSLRSFNPSNHTRNFARCVMGQYPSLDEAIELIVCEEVESVAFARKWAMDRPNSSNKKRKVSRLFYRGDPVGIVVDEPKLEDRYAFLNEQLQEAMQ